MTQEEKQLKALEKKVKAEYRQAVKEMRQKLKDYTAEYKNENAKMKEKVKNGKIDKAAYDKWKKDELIIKDYWKSLKDVLAEDFHNADKIAMSLVKDTVPDAFALGHSVASYELEHGFGMNFNFSLYSRDAVKRLMKEDQKLLPDPKVDIPKDRRWNRQHIQSAITQGVLQGESVDHIAKRLEDVLGMDERSALRNARTAMTGAHNAGRVESYRQLLKYGIKVKKEWLAALDKKTRMSHREMDGEQAELDEVFSNGCRYPGDPAGPPQEVYNCRCTLVPAIEGIDQSKAPRDSKLGSMSYDDWKKGKDKQKKKAAKKKAAKKAAAQKAAKAVKQAASKSLPPKPDPFADPYSQKRKDAALWAQSQKEADDVLRGKCGEVWRGITEDQRDALWRYTGSAYRRWNGDLRALDYNGSADKDAIKAMTEAIDKSSYGRDIWLTRGSGATGADKFLGVDIDLLLKGTQEELEASLLGKTVTEYGFCSCGSSSGQGFTGKKIMYNIYCPEGTKMMYAEPFSRFGGSHEGKNWDGIKKQKYFGSEDETILQQGTSFLIRGVKLDKHGTINLEMDVVAQNPQR